MSNEELQKMQKAVIRPVDKNGEPIDTEKKVECMFNPFEYTITKSNSYDMSPRNQSDTPNEDFKMSNPQTLTLSLVFDTYEKGEDVSEKTRKLWALMETKNQEKNNKSGRVEPPYVAFSWGTLFFVACITNMTQRFTLFKHDGTPVRAKVDVTFTQYIDVEDYRSKKQNPTSGGGQPERVWKVVSGDRLDAIAARVFGDANQWRRIADHNRLSNPLNLSPGQLLRIPLD
jgi:hypothetical protein